MIGFDTALIFKKGYCRIGHVVGENVSVEIDDPHAAPSYQSVENRQLRVDNPVYIW